ncbi:competence type IV pilus minor pilin ComGD [Lysinibacillus piscis]|uniref:Competence protein ComG n=1 Tax=Lysinibacillus piscis TaxID=2518931 RepID=A0ABQ5NKV8_9BACI|nr:competence type IV pilus minor pilin ComGD [Lysinibacillus sp. KH24]GLC88717.1 hypothetical protein LYSBPC_18440 [Lysinibacillus sp. KH24]
MVKSQQGFTLLETLLVLFIMICLSTLIVKFSFSIAEKREIDRFFKQMQLDIQYTQIYNMHRREYLEMRFEESARHYGVKKDLYTYVYKRPYPKGVEFAPSPSTIIAIRYTNTGSIVNAGTLIFRTPYGTKRVILTLGRGRARVE